MILKVFGVRDVKAVAFLQPFFSGQSGSALRAFSDAVNDGKSPICMHPEDYMLYELGEFDDNSGSMMSLNPIKLLGCGSDFTVRPTSPVRFDSVPLKSDVGAEVSNGS